MRYDPEVVSVWVDLLWKLGAALLALATTVWAVVKRPLETKISNCDNRVKTLSRNVIGIETSLEVLEGKAIQSEMDRSNLHAQLGRLEGIVEKVVQSMEVQRDKREKVDKEILQRLSSIEGKVDYMRGRNA